VPLRPEDRRRPPAVEAFRARLLAENRELAALLLPEAPEAPHEAEAAP
jgi:hypothetical protein